MTSRLLARVPVIPFYNQVSIGDYKDTAVPDWDSASFDAGVSSSETRLLIVTCNDQDGYVIVDIRDGEPKAGYGKMVFNGTLRIDSQTLTIGPVTADPSRVMFLPRPGGWNIRVYVDPLRRARHVTVLLEDYDDPDMPNVSWMNS